MKKEENEAKWYVETYYENMFSYDDLQRFINKLNNNERQVIGYEIKTEAGRKEIKVTFARKDNKW